MGFESRLKGFDRGTEPNVRWEVIAVSGTKHTENLVTVFGIGFQHIKKFLRG